MKLSHAIAVLQIALAEHGDLDLYEGVVFGDAPPLSHFSVGRHPEHLGRALLLWAYGKHARPVEEVPA